jgi:hypothetical protein
MPIGERLDEAWQRLTVIEVVGLGCRAQQTVHDEDFM